MWMVRQNLTLEFTAVTIFTTRFNIQKSIFCLHSVFMMIIIEVLIFSAVRPCSLLSYYRILGGHNRKMAKEMEN